MECVLAKPSRPTAMGGSACNQPLPRAQPKGLNQAAETPPPASSPVLLLVDDQPVQLRALASIFENQGYELVLAGSGAEAIASMDRRCPDLVLLDVNMPVMNGFEVCRTIRSSPKISQVPIILVTAYDDREARLEGKRSGADDVLPKPVERTELRTRVATIVGCDRGRGSIVPRTNRQ
jgi:CheY-like chemotaxis protein